jgi:hypothetical protein
MTIDLCALAGVTGGSSTTTQQLGPYEHTTSTSDYQACANAVTRLTGQQYPATASWWNPFSTDTNAPTRAAATIKNLQSTCGVPGAN